MEEIRLGSTDSVFSTNEKNTVEIQLGSTTKLMPITDVSTIVDQYDVYRRESAACEKYRLTLTMKPYCTNVLFNTCTEITYNEGADNTDTLVATDNDTITLPGEISRSKVGGKTSNLTRSYMVDNTEYSSEEIGFNYHPGYDIFGNHIIRNLTFRSIIPITTHNAKYNTIEDTMRTVNGDTIKTPTRRFSDDTQMVNKHVYETTGIMSMNSGDSVAENLLVENGWYGFYNNSSITPKRVNKNGTIDERDSSHVINNMGNCEFVDMYPDRTLYSFTPKLNKYQRRMERNWDVFITYPYKNFYRHNLVTNVYAYTNDSTITPYDNATGDMETNALLLMEAKSQYCRNGMQGVEFRSFCKHNVSANDNIVLYYSMDGGISFIPCETTFRVDYVGDMKSENDDYYFAITNSSVLDEIFNGHITDYFYDETMEAPSHFIEISGDITDIPQELDTSDSTYEPNICQWYYKILSSEPSTNWTSDNTVDDIPSDIKNGPVYIRKKIKVGDGYEYTYYQYINGMYQGIDEPVNQVFGDGNTFDDIPIGYVTDYIRVYRYEYFQKAYRYYIQKEERVETIINNLLCNEIPLRFCKITNGIKSKYYIRMFKKLPNFRYSSEDLTKDISSNPVKFDEYIQRNATKNGKMRDFEHEIYPLAFSKTIYGDDITQIQFTDTIDINYLRDNLQRPLTEMYATVVKRNRGYKEWYQDGIHGDYYDNTHVRQSIEFSHCFGKVTSGFDFFCKSTDDSISYRKNKSFLSDAKVITNAATVENKGYSLEDWGNVNTHMGTTDGILETDEIFFGDVVEYNPSRVIETSLSDVQFRFNTAQRECGKDEEYTFTYKEIISNDYDENGFETEEHINERPLICPEGYYYKAHYPIKLKTLSPTVSQASHFSVLVNKAEPKQMEGIFIRIETLNKHGYGSGRKVFICNDVDKVWYSSEIVYVDSSTSFIINPISKNVEVYEDKPYIDWIETCNLINNGELKIRVANEQIPDYADNILTNLFLWREVIPAANSDDEEINTYPYTNRALYIDNSINFYLKRQDPEATNGLYYHGAFPDVEGKIQMQSNYVYIPESEITC